MEFRRMRCVPCEGGVKPMSQLEARRNLKSVSGWKLARKAITKSVKLKDFKNAIRLVNRVAAIAEKEGHHPDISIYDYRNVKFTLTTHAISGLSRNDFIMAAKIDSVRM